MRPKVEIIILNWNGKDYLNQCLEMLYRKTSYSNFNVTVVDNGSSDGSKGMLRERFSQVDLVTNERNLGFSIGANMGIKEVSDSEYYLLLNNDTKPKDNWLSEMVKVAEENEAGIVGSKLLYPDGTVQHAGGKFGKNGPMQIGVGKHPDQFTKDREVKFVVGAAFLINSEVKESIGYLDELFSPAMREETDYCDRAKKAGFQIYLAADSVLIHYEGKTQEKNPSKFSYFIGRKNTLKYNFMNSSGINIFKALWIEIKYLGASIIGYDYNPMRELLKAYKEFLMDLPALVHKRYNRTEFVPSYYCEGMKDYSMRYESKQ